MKDLLRAAVFVGIGLGVVLIVLGAVSAETKSEAKKCCFASPGFSGICEVTPGEDETCASILAYLNNPNAVGKSYCGNTKVRGTWKQVDCKEK
jgi:hypothetical protein